MHLLEQLEYQCYNCEASYQVVSNEDELAVCFCPFCGSEVGDTESFDEEDEDEEQ